MPKYSVNVNGEVHKVDALEDMPLLWVLRDLIGLTGTKYGCGKSLCGACTVHLDDKPVRSCSVAIASVGEGKITTIEGLSAEGDHPIQEAWEEFVVPQCGYCQTGQIMSAVALIKSNPHPSEQEIEQHMQGNLCRCGTYNRIKAAIMSVSDNKPSI
jgi:isoquinoline 1-oxidoreductase alpha subunit